MTCIVGLRRNGHIYIGADTTGVTDDGWGLIVPVGTSKVWKNGPFVFGSSGSYRAIQVIRHELEHFDLLSTDRREHDPIGESFMVTKLVPAIKALLEQYSFSEKKDERSTQGANFLIGIRSSLFLLQDDYAVLELDSQYASIGSGSHVALGALDILVQNTKLAAATIVERALTAAHKHINTVGPPGPMLSTKD